MPSQYVSFDEELYVKACVLREKDGMKNFSELMNKALAEYLRRKGTELTEDVRAKFGVE